MSELKIHADHDGATPTFQTDDPALIASRLQAAGVRFEQWQANQPITAGAAQEEVLAAYRPDVERLVSEQGYQTVDVISINASHPDKDALRQKFLSEHTHSEDEVRFFVAGQGLFSLHIGSSVYEVLCQQGDLISVPADTPHWFDMGSQPDLVAIRFFDNPEGWVARFTGSAIADQFSRLS